MDTTPLAFGKYRGQTPEWIADNDPGYLVWVYENTNITVCSRDLYLACVDEVEASKYDNFGEEYWHE